MNNNSTTGQFVVCEQKTSWKTLLIAARWGKMCSLLQVFNEFSLVLRFAVVVVLLFSEFLFGFCPPFSLFQPLSVPSPLSPFYFLPFCKTCCILAGAADTACWESFWFLFFANPTTSNTLIRLLYVRG